MSGLIPAAALAWSVSLVAIVALVQGAPASTLARALVLAAVAVGGSALICALLRRWAASSCLLVAAVTALSVASYAGTVTPEPLQAEGSHVAAVVTVIGDMRLRDSGGEPALDVRAHLTRVEVRGQAWELGSPVILRMPPDTAPPIGAVLRVTGSLEPGDPLRGFAALIEIDAHEVVAQPGALGALANAVRASLRASLEDAPPRAASLVEGLAVGDETSQPPELGEQMRVAGLSHLTAVSGGNTSIVVATSLLVATLLGLGVIGRVVAALAALGAFVVVVGPQPSVLRAAVMAVVVLLAIITGARRTGMHGLALAVVVLIIASPALATSWGFALSVAATAGLLLLAAPMVARAGSAGRVRTSIVSALALTLGAQVTTLPLIASFGDGLSLAAVPANLLAAPAVAPVTVLGLLAAVTGMAAPGVGAALARCAEPFAAWIALIAEWTSSWPVATLPWPGGLPGALLAGAVALVLARVIRRHRGRHERAWQPRVMVATSVAVAIVAVLALRLPDRAGWPPAGWVAVACDVGQGDALVLRGASGGAVLIDAGPDPMAVDRCLDDLGIDRIDLVVLTHHHADHVDGLPGAIGGRAVEAAMVSPLREPVDQAIKVEDWLTGIPVTAAQPGQTMDVDGISLVVLWPQRVIRGPESAPNNASVVLLADVHGVRMLLLGDVEVAAQVALRTSLAAPGVDVVKVAHHGSRFQDPALASWTSGRVAIMSVGAGNRYGHPAEETLRAWSLAGALVARTDLAGDVAIVGPRLGVVTRHTVPG